MSDTKEPPRSSSIELAEDPEFQRKDWAVQRAGWVLLGLVMIAAALGLLGGMGPLARKSATSSDGSLHIEYSAVARHRSPGELTINLRAGQTEPSLQLWVDRGYLQNADLLRITPEPESSLLEQNRITYTFRLENSPREVSIVFDIEPVKVGMQRGSLGVVGGPELAFSTFVFP
jgi:hypothetical protein